MEYLSSQMENPAFWVTVAFLIFIGLAARPVCRLLATSLDRRAKFIGEEIDQAIALREEAQAVLSTYQKKQRESMREAEEIIQKANLEARRITKEAEADMEETLKKRMKMAMDKIEQAERKAIQDVQDHVIDITVAATKNIIEGKLSGPARDELVRRATNDIQKKLH